jgi:dienelactone hydrolase
MSAVPSALPQQPRRLSGVRSWRPSGRGFLRGLGRVLLGVVIAVAIFVAVASVMRLQHASLPAVTGGSAVGRTEIALTDTLRTDPFATDGRSRELAVWIWYPAVAGPSDAAAPYVPAAWGPLVSDLPLSQDLTAVSANSLAGAALEGRPPVVVLQPGLGQPVADYTTLAEELASHGFAVIGINETGSAPTAFPDGHTVPATPLGGVSAMDVDAWYASAARVTDVWVADAQFVVKTLSETPPAIGALDFSRVAYLGHSLGGAAAFEACSQDATCSAAVDLDGTLWTDVRHTGFSAPHLLVERAPEGGCDQFCSRAATDFATVMGTGESEWLSVAGSVHQNFSDVGLRYGIANGLLGSIDAQRMTLITRDAVRSFLDVHVLGAAAADFTATVDRYAELTGSK